MNTEQLNSRRKNVKENHMKIGFNDLSHISVFSFFIADETKMVYEQMA